MRFYILTLFPEFFDSVFGSSMLKRAIAGGLIGVELVDIRQFTSDRHRTADDYPYGGGSGMVLKFPPVSRAIGWVKEREPGCTVILMTPQGEVFNQKLAGELASQDCLAIVCGHYEGVDERVSSLCHREVSIGDYVLTGGELAAAVVVDAVSRLVPGVLGNADSAAAESFAANLLEWPQYTRPAEWQEMGVPEVLLSGHHERIKVWRRTSSLQRTILRRPDLMVDAELSEEDLRLIKELKTQAG
ncbi:MAG: tRNA (guanosine(37)-N1)-methyltransferase TrmD [Bacillota bacterium]